MEYNVRYYETNVQFLIFFYVDNILLDYIFYYGNIKFLHIKIFKFQ